MIFFVDWIARDPSPEDALLTTGHFDLLRLERSCRTSASPSASASVAVDVGVARRPSSRCGPGTTALNVGDRASTQRRLVGQRARCRGSRRAGRRGGCGTHSSSSVSKRRTSSTGEVVEHAGGAGVDRHHLLLDRHRRVERLLQQLDQAVAALELRLRHRVELGTERGERLELTELREVELQRSGDRLHRLDLRGATDAGHRDAHVDGRAHTRLEEVVLQVDLAVGDRDHVGRDVRRDVTGLGLDDRQRGERAGAELVAQLRGTLEQAAVQVEDVAGVRLAARRAAQQQRHLAVRLGLLRQVVVHDERVLAVVHPVLADRAAGVRGEVLEHGLVGRGRVHHDRVLHRAVLLERGDGLRDRRALLADRDVDALHALALLVRGSCRSRRWSCRSCGRR